MLVFSDNKEQNDSMDNEYDGVIADNILNEIYAKNTDTLVPKNNNQRDWWCIIF